MGRGRPKYNTVKITKFKVNYGRDVWHFDEDKNPHGPYMVEIGQEPEQIKLDKLYNKLESLKDPEYHKNGRKKRITKYLKKEIKMAEVAYREEYNKVFPKNSSG